MWMLIVMLCSTHVSDKACVRTRPKVTIAGLLGGYLENEEGGVGTMLTELKALKPPKGMRFVILKAPYLGA